MDFLKTLLAYMALFTTLGVQEGPAPDTVPTPTPLPAHITASPVPFQTAAPTATPTPTIAPGPTLTPNRRYGKVDFGDSGSQVRKLQNRLIELGYMPKGSADSKYGYQTYNAVKDFQQANGLDVDGIAGPSTLTYLYENPNVVRIGTAPTDVPTATPTQEPAAASDSTNTVPTATVSTSSKTGSKITAAVTVSPNQKNNASAPVATATAVPTPTPTPEPLVPQDITVETAHPAELATLADAYIISDGKTLYYETMLNGKRALVKPNLWQSEFGAAVVSLPQLADALDWQLKKSGSDGLYTLYACGYEITIHSQAGGLLVLVDGEPVFVPDENVMVHNGTLFISEAFLRMTIGADTVYDRSENALVLFLTDKSKAGAQD